MARSPVAENKKIKKRSSISPATADTPTPETEQPIERWLDLLNADPGEAVISFLANMGADAVGPVINVLLGPRTRNGYENAQQVLVRIGEPAVGPLIALLEQDYHSAAWLLGQMRAERAVPQLIAALQGKDQFLRWAAVEALCRIGAKESVPALIPKLRDRASLVRLSAVQALGQLGDTSAIEDLLRLTNDKYVGIRNAVQEAVGAIRAREARETA